MKKLRNSLLACVLVFTMIFTICSTSFAAVEELFEGTTINYVNLGASNGNGYGLAGYLPEGVTAENKETANVYGYRRTPAGSYAVLVKDALEAEGYTVNLDQLAISSMRVEELRLLLDNNYNGDAYTNWRFTGGDNWFLNAEPGGLDDLRTTYQTAVENADLITIDIGVNNFGVYLSNQISSGGTKYDDDLSLVDPEMAEAYNKAKEYVKGIIIENAGEYAAAVSGLEFVVDAMAYALAGFCVNFDIVMEKIYELNPDATVVTVSIQNLMEGLEATIPKVSSPIPFGELFGALVDAANLYIAVGSSYSDDYLFADVSKNGRVEFFLDQLLAYDGNPASLDGDMKDCFDLYDDDLMVSTRVQAIASGYSLNAEQTENALNIAYDVVAEIMQLGAKNNVLDLTTILAGNYGSVEDGLLDSIEDEVIDAISSVVADPTYTYEIDENFFNNISDAAGVPSELVNTVATLGIRTGIGNSFYGHPNRNGHIEVKNAIINALDNKVTGLEALKTRLGISDEEENLIREIIAEVQGIIDVAQNGTKEEQEEKVREYLELIKAELSEEELAKVNEFIADITEIIEIIQTTSPESVKAEIDSYIAELEAKVAAEIAKIGHEEYTVNEESSYYVALGGGTAYGVGTVYPAKPYYILLADELNLSDTKVNGLGSKNLLPSDILEYIKANEDEISKADLITYQADASSFINAIFSDKTPDWNKYIDEEVAAIIEDVIAKTTEILLADWETYASAEVDEIAVKIREAAIEGLSEYIMVDSFVEDIIDNIIEPCVSCVKTAIALIEAEKDYAIDYVTSELEGIDESVIEYAEKLAYAVVAYAVDTIKAIETVQEINPDAALYIVGMYNPLKGLNFIVNENTIDAGEIFDYVIRATNLYYAGCAIENGNFAFVDVSETATNGFGGTVMEIEGFIGAVLSGLEDKMYANAEGHEYIKDQIVKAMSCDYAYEQLDADNHTVKCTLCESSYTEEHTFSGTTCTLCGYVKSTESKPVYSGGGSSSSGRFIIRFETNGGSAVANIAVKDGELLTPPAAPTKDGFVFEGWYTDKNLTVKYDFATPVTKSFTLYAKWVAEDKLAKFTDLDKNAWYYEYVKAIVEKGLMNGISETQFAPEMEVTRGMFVTILYRAAGAPDVEATTSFTDVSADKYYAKAVAWANANGIVKGITETEFVPDNNITREQMAAMLYRYNNEKTATGEITYTDKETISDYALDAVEWAKAAGIMEGNADGTFAPVRNASRAEAAAVFVRLLKL